MNRAISRVSLLALSGLLLALGGCEYRTVMISIPDFFSSEVSGVTMYRMDDATGSYVAQGVIEFGEPYLDDGSWRVDYTTVGPTGEESLNLWAYFDPENGDGVTLDIWYARFEDPGSFKAATFNAAGESPLSDETIGL